MFPEFDKDESASLIISTKCLNIASELISNQENIRKPEGAFLEATAELRNFFGESPDYPDKFISLTETPLREIEKREDTIKAITQLAYEPEQFESILNYDERTEVHAVNLMPSCSALVKNLTGKNISGFRSFKISKPIHNQLDLIAYQGKFKNKEFSNGRQLAFKAEVESNEQTIFVRGYPRKDRILNVVHQPVDISQVVNLNEDLTLVQSDTLFKFRSFNIPDNFIPKKLLKENMPYVISTIAYHLGGSFMEDTSFLKKLSDLASSGAKTGAFIYAFKDCSLPPSNFFNGKAYFVGEVDLQFLEKNSSGTQVIPCSFKAVNPTQDLNYEIKLDLALVSYN